MVDSTKNCVTAVVEYDYTAKEPDELDLVRGAIIHSIKQMPGGWWEGTLQMNGKTGMFPDNFVRVVDMNEDNTVVLRDKSTASNRRCKVIYSYTQVNDDELSLAVGDVIEFLGEVEEGWWRGRLKDKIGVFPSNFVKLIDSSPVFASKRPPSTTKQTTKSANSTTTATSSSSTAAAAKKINRLSFHNSKEDLLSATPTATTTNNSSSSLSSSTTVATPASSLLLRNGGGGDDAGAPSLPPKPQRDYCRVEFPYAPQNDDELDLKVGDIITIHSMDLPDKGWWKGELKGKIGVFPDNFVKLMAPSEVSPLNDLHQQQSQPQQSHRTTAKLSNTNNVTIASNNSATAATTTATSTSSNIKSLIKKSGSSSSTQSSNRKDSFGSRDSLNDILSETGLPTGNVAAQRKSLENKNLDLTNASDVAARLALKKQQLHMQQQQQQQQQQQESKTITTSISSNNTSTLISATASSSELRKSTENMDEKTKTTPPPVLNKKPTVPVKKTTTVTSITGNILSGIKQKVKNVENKLTTAASHDYADGVGSSKLSPSSVADSGSTGVVMRRAATIAVEDTDFDHVERGSILSDMRAGRVKAPKRRPPSAAIIAIGESNNNSLYVNGNASDTTHSGDDQLKSDDNSTGEEQLAKPKPREWEKKKAPWMEELKASQVKKKTSPSVTDTATVISERNSKLYGDDIKITNNSSVQTTSSMQATNTTTTSSYCPSSATSTTKLQSSSVLSTSTMQQSMIAESSSNNLTEAMTKSLSSKIASDVLTASNNTSHSSNSSGHLLDDVRARPSSLSIRNRSTSPSMAATRNILKSNATATNTTTTTNSASPAEANSTTTSTSQSTVAKSTHLNSSSTNHLVNSSGAANTGSHKIAELETRIDKLEMLVHAQQRTIDELVRTLREETDRNKVLRAELDKYAQCVTQV